MTGGRHAPTGGSSGTWGRRAEWVRRKDPGLLAIRRSVRAAIAMPTVFGLTHVLFSDPQVSLLGALGSFSHPPVVNFPGPPRIRLLSYVLLWLVGSGLIALGTVVSTDKWAAVAVMAVVGFRRALRGDRVTYGSGIDGDVARLRAAGRGGPAGIGHWPEAARVVFAGVVCITACMVLWPTPWHDDLRRRLSATVGAVAGLAAANAGGKPIRGGLDRTG